MASHIAALSRDPTSSQAAEAVRSSARQTGAFRAYAEAFAERGESLWARGEREVALEAWIEAALVSEEDVGDLPQAAMLYERVLDVDPDHRRALFALGLVLHDLQRWEELIALYRRRLARTSDEGERATLLLYVAELLQDKKNDPHAAFEVLMDAIARAPQSLRTLSRLEELGEQTKRLDEVAIAIGDMLLHQEDPHLRAALSLRLADMYLGPLDNPSRALVHLRSALYDDGANPDVLGEIEDVFRERARFDELAALLEEVTQDGRIGPHRVRLELELARIYEHELDDPTRALAALIRALEGLPEDRELLDEVLRLGMAEGDVSSVARAFERTLRGTNNRLLATYLRLKLGHIYAELLEQVEEAKRVYGEILELEPDHEEAAQSLRALRDRMREGPSMPVPDAGGLAAGEVHPEDETVFDGEELEEDGVVHAVDKALALVARVERLRALADRPAASAKAPEVDRPRAEDAAELAEVLPIAPTRLALRASPQAESDEEGATGALERAGEGGPGPKDDEPKLVGQDAGTREDGPPGEPDPGPAPADLGPPEAAAEAFRAMTSHPDLPPPSSVTSEAEAPVTAEAVSSAQGDEPASRALEGPDPSVPPDLAETSDVLEEDLASSLQLLQDSLEEDLSRTPEAGHPSALAEWEAALEGLEGPDRSRGQLRLAQGWAASGEPERAEEILRSGLIERAGDLELLDALMELLERQGRWNDWLGAAERRVESESGGASAMALRLRMSEVAASELGDVGWAWRLAEQAAEHAPEQVRPLQVLERLARDAGDGEARVRVLHRLTALRPEEPEAHRALGAALRAGEQFREAVAAYERAAHLEADDLDTQWALAELHDELAMEAEARARYAALSERGPESRRALAGVRRAELELRRPDGLDAARAALEAAVTSDPGSREALALLCDLAEREGDPRRASALAERCGDVETALVPRAGWLFRAARLADLGVGDARRAMDLYRAALRLDPDHPDAEARLGLLLLERGEIADAYRHLSNAAEGFRDEERAAELFERAGQAAEAAVSRAAALDAYESALKRSPTRLQALLRSSVLYAEDGDLANAHDRSATLILHHERSLAASDRAACFSRMARGKLEAGDPQGAVRLARKAESESSDDTRILHLLATALEASGECEAAAEVLRRLAGRLPAGSARAEALVDAARLFGDEGAAARARRVAVLEEALAELPEDVELAERLAQARLASGDAGAAADALEHGARRLAGARRSDLLHQAAETVRTTARSRAKAILREAVAGDAGHTASVESLDVLFGADGEHEERLDLLEAAARSAASSAEAQDWRSRAVRVAESHLSRADRALAIDPGADEQATQHSDLLFRRARHFDAGLGEAQRVWAAIASERPSDRRALERLIELHMQAGATGLARFALELDAVVHGGALPDDAPHPCAPPGAVVVDPDPAEADGPDAPLRSTLGLILLQALADEVPGTRPRRRDAVGPAALGIRLSRPLDDAARALGYPLPRLFVYEGPSPIAAGWAFGPALLVSPQQSREVDETGLRFLAGQALADLRPHVLPLQLLPLEAIRSAWTGLAAAEPLAGDPVDPRTVRRRGRALERLLDPAQRAKALELARAWLSDPTRRSLREAQAAAARTAHRMGLVAAGSPIVASGALAGAERRRLLRFAFRALVLGVSALDNGNPPLQSRATGAEREQGLSPAP